MPVLYLPRDWQNRLNKALDEPEKTKDAMKNLTEEQTESMRYLYKNERDRRKSNEN